MQHIDHRREEAVALTLFFTLEGIRRSASINISAEPEAEGRGKGGFRTSGDKVRRASPFPTRLVRV